jgi:hypothetical protein
VNELPCQYTSNVSRLHWYDIAELGQMQSSRVPKAGQDRIIVFHQSSSHIPSRTHYEHGKVDAVVSPDPMKGLQPS